MIWPAHPATGAHALQPAAAFAAASRTQGVASSTRHVPTCLPQRLSAVPASAWWRPPARHSASTASRPPPCTAEPPRVAHWKAVSRAHTCPVTHGPFPSPAARLASPHQPCRAALPWGRPFCGRAGPAELAPPADCAQASDCPAPSLRSARRGSLQLRNVLLLLGKPRLAGPRALAGQRQLCPQPLFVVLQWAGSAGTARAGAAAPARPPRAQACNVTPATAAAMYGQHQRHQRTSVCRSSLQ